MVLELTCKCEYSLLALMELADFYVSGQPLQIRQIAARQNIPERYLEQLLLTLKRGGFVRSQRGINGGYTLAGEPSTISLLDIISCIEGNDSSRSESNCATQTPESMIIQDVWSKACCAAEDVLSNYTLKDLLEQRDAAHQSGQMYYI